MVSTTLFEIKENALKTILEYYERTSESLTEDVNNLKKWMGSQPHLPEILDDKSIENFLILNKCSVEKSKKSIDAYYTLRDQVPEIFENANPSKTIIKEALEIMYWLPLPKMTKDNYRVLFFKMRRPEMIDLMEPYNLIASIANLQELRLKEDLMFGDISIIDMEGINFGYVKKITPSVLTKLFALYEKVFSMRIKGMYILNAPSFIGTVLNLIKSFLKPKVADRVFVCRDTSILYKDFPNEILPKDYGGQEMSLEEIQKIFILKLDQYQDRFDLLDKLRVKEDLRPEKLTNDELLGFYGNFKKLNVD